MSHTSLSHWGMHEIDQAAEYCRTELTQPLPERTSEPSQAALNADPEVIYLQPDCPCVNHDGRCWSTDSDDFCDSCQDCEKKPTKYIRADMCDAAVEPYRQALRDLIYQLRPHAKGPLCLDALQAIDNANKLLGE